MIKECPTCKRTYADPSIAFCLADGSLLSAPFDPQATLHLPISQSSEPRPTEIINSAPHSNSLPPTQRAIEAIDIPPTFASPMVGDPSNDSTLVSQQSEESTALVGFSRRKGIKLWVGLGILFGLAAVYTQSIIPALPAFAMFVIALFVSFKKSDYEQL